MIIHIIELYSSYNLSEDLFRYNHFGRSQSSEQALFPYSLPLVR